MKNILFIALCVFCAWQALQYQDCYSISCIVYNILYSVLSVVCAWQAIK